MEKINYDLEKELQKGNFEYLSLDYWFKTHQYNYVYYAICGCDKVINKDILNFIVTYAELLLLCPNEDSKHSKEDIIFNCEELLIKAIIVGSKHYSEYKDIVDPLFHSTNDTIRMYCWANLDLKNRWWCSETSPRIRKVHNIREEFNFCWDNSIFDSNTKQRITYLAKACELGVISCVTSTTSDRDNELTPVTISSFLFEKQAINIPKFDIDILETIQDKRILGYCLNRMFEEGLLKFKSDVKLPYYFADISNKNLVKARRSVAADVFDKMYQVKN